MVVKTSDFELDAFIPNRDDAPNSDILGNEVELQGFIDRYETELLIELLGYKMFQDFKDAIDFSVDPPVLEAGADVKWLELMNGFENYRGMKQFIISYIFYKFLENDDSHYSTVGVQKENSDNATLFESRPKAIQQYRMFFDHAIGNFYNGTIGTKSSIFGSLSFVIWSGAGVGGKSTNFIGLYEYVNDKGIDVFPDWEPTNFKNKNYFDV